MRAPPARKPALNFIFVTLLLAVMGFGLLIPVLPDLTKKFCGNDVSAGASAYGWLVSVFALMQFVASPILGALSDRFGRRRIILISTAGAAIDYVIMANAPTLSWLFVGRMVSGATAGVLATANAYVADVTPPEKRAQSFGLLGAAFGLGFVLGPALGGALGRINLQLPFWFAAGCAALNWLWGYFFLPESLPADSRRAFDWKRANPLGALLAVRRFPSVVGLIDCHFISYVAQTMLQSTWVLCMEHRYGWDTLQNGFSLMAAGALMGVVQATLVKRIVPKLGEPRAVLMGFGISIVAFVCYGLAAHGWMIYLIMTAAAITGVAGPALQAYITRHVPANEQGAVQGLFSSLTSLASIIGPFIGAHTFGWAVAPERAVSVPGIAFFESALLYIIVFALAWRTFRADARHAHLKISTTAPEPAKA
jgi:DHA1 family tetracycline resistance protein-like MFS transporter